MSTSIENNKDNIKFWNDKVKCVSPYVPGAQLNDKKYIKLNTNENAYSPSEKVKEAIKKAANEDLRLYPDIAMNVLKDKIAKRYNINAENVFLGNGSDEVLGLCFQSFFDSKKDITFPNITYSFYKVYAAFYDVPSIIVPLKDDFTLDMNTIPKAHGILLANPNASTGEFISRDEIEKLVINRKDSLVIIDEAYIDFGGESVAPLVKQYDNLLVIQTMSKSKALAGMRLGYAIGNEKLITALEIVKNCFNSYPVDTVCYEAGKAALDDDEYYNRVNAQIVDTREQVKKELQDLGFFSTNSKGNFIFVKHNTIDGKEIFEYLQEQGILVRRFAQKEIQDFLRISIGTRADMTVLIEKVATFLKSKTNQRV